MPRSSLSRRRFLEFLSLGAVMTALPFSLNATSTTVTRSGYVKKIPGGYLFTSHRHHCDYCYLGHENTILKISSGHNLPEGAVSLRGKISGRYFICETA